MSELSQAEKYAESISAPIWEAVENGGNLFGDEPNDDGEPMSPWDYLAQALEIDYRVSASGQYRAAFILIGCGGPNVMVNTDTRNLEVVWGSDKVYRSLPTGFCDALDDAARELYESR